MVIHMTRIAGSIQNLLKLCWLVNIYTQLSTLSAAWECSWQQFGRLQQPFEWTWQRRQELIEGNGILEYYHYLQLVDTLKHILKGIFISISKEQCTNRGECRWTAENGCDNIIMDKLCESEWCHIEDMPGAKWVSTKFKQCFASPLSYTAWWLVEEIHKWHTGGLYRQNRMQNVPCPILKPRVNRAWMHFGLEYHLIDQRIGRFDAYRKYWPPWSDKKHPICLLLNHENEW